MPKEEAMAERVPLFPTLTFKHQHLSVILKTIFREKLEVPWWGLGNSQSGCKIKKGKKEHLGSIFTAKEKLMAVSLSHFRGYDGLRSENS